MNPLEQLRARLGELTAANQQIIDQADADGRDLSEDEAKQIDETLAEIERVTADISRRERIQAAAGNANSGPGRRTAAAPGVQPTNGGNRQTVPAAPRRDDPRGGFQNFGEFAACVRMAGIGAQPDGRLLNAVTTYGNEGTGADGGFAVPPEFRTQIWEKVMGEETLLSRTDQLTSSSNNLVLPTDETTPWQTSGGVQAYWESEAGTLTASKPNLGQQSIRLNKLTALVPVTEELLEDAPGMESYLRRKAPMKMASKINTAIISGTGVGQPLGILRSASLVSVAKETSQPADTIRYANIVKMWSRMYAPCRRNSIWLINQDIEPQLLALSFDPAATSKVPVYLPANGLADSPYATLMGRPVVPVSAAKTLGDQGDITLVDLSQYMTVTKGNAVRTDVSIHLYFDQAVTTFRFIMRLAGQPWWASTITPENGNNTLGWAVVLDDRS